MNSEEILDHRKNKFLKIGRGGGFAKPSSEGETGLEFKEPIIHFFLASKLETFGKK